MHEVEQANPLVTCVVPLHNHQRFVGDCIRSLAVQDYRPIRIVVVDDGSTDGGHDHILSLLSEVDRAPFGGEPAVWSGQLTVGDSPSVQVLLCRFSEARGPSFARNYAIKAAWESTVYYALLDSDDEYTQGKIRRSVEKFLGTSDCLICYSDYDTVDPNGLRLRQFKEPFSRERLLRECIVNSDSLISRECLDKVGLFDETLRVAEDLDYWLRASEVGLIVHIPDSLVKIRVGSHSSTDTVQKQVWEKCWQRVYQKLEERMRKR